jgi:hypothetical protein
MADLTIKAGDTWPPLRGRAEDQDGLLDLVDAEQILVIIKHSSGTPLLVKDATAIDPPDSDNMNWNTPWDEGDTDVIGSYDVELEITWDSLSTPPKVQTVPNDNTMSLDIVDDLGGDR